MLLNSKAQTLTYTECRIRTGAGMNNIKEKIINGSVPDGNAYIPVVIAHSSNNSVTECPSTIGIYPISLGALPVMIESLIMVIPAFACTLHPIKVSV